MAALVSCLVRLRDEFNTIAPSRAKGADGWIGDAAHTAHTSDHNPDSRGLVHAIDITTDLNESDLTLEKCVQHILTYCRRSNSDPLNEPRLRYIIFNRRIWSAPNWTQTVYTGTADPHTGHAHFSAEHIPTLENDKSTWHLEEIPVALTAADKTWMQNTIGAQIAGSREKELVETNAMITAAVDDILAVRIGDAAYAVRTVGDVLRDVAKLRDYLVGDGPGTANAALKPTAPVVHMSTAADIIITDAAPE